ASRLAPTRRVEAVLLTAANPLLLMFVVSAAHVDGLMCALLLAALLAARRRSPIAAVVLAAAAGSVKAPAFIAVLFIVVRHARELRGPARIRSVAIDLAAAAATVLACALVVPDG